MNRPLALGTYACTLTLLFVYFLLSARERKEEDERDEMIYLPKEVRREKEREGEREKWECETRVWNWMWICGKGLKVIKFEKNFIIQKAFTKQTHSSQVSPSRCAPKPQPRFIFYLRIGKAGSTTLRDWINRYANQWRFTKYFQIWSLLLKRVRIRGIKTEGSDAEEILSLEEESDLIRDIFKEYRGRNQLHIQHTFYLNFSRHGFPQVFHFSTMDHLN